MMINWGKVVFVLLCIIHVTVRGQESIGLRASSSIRGLTFGTAASIANIRNNVDAGQFNANIKRNYHLIEPENDLKPQKLWRGENNYDWNDSDWLLGGTLESTGWAQENSMQIRGHTLVWATDERIPNWLLQQESSITSEKAMSLLGDYIGTVVSRYRGKIPSWDVVNEAVDDTQNNGRSFNMRNCFWYRKLGQDFFKYAFIFAHQADPQAQLYYNDYNTEGMGPKANSAFQLITWARSQGAIIHGVGMQWHIGLWVTLHPGDQYYQNAQRLIDNGFEFMITELDVALPMNDSNLQDPNDLEKQAIVYRAFVKYALHFSPKCRAFITWGFTDRYSWIPSFSNYGNGAALPMDWNYNPKPAYWQMQEELTRMFSDGTYRLTLESQPNKCLGTFDKGKLGGIKITSIENDQSNQKWNLFWLGDGTYRLTPVNNPDHALDTYFEDTTQGELQTYPWWGGNNQRWIFSPVESNKFRIAPRTVWWRALTVDSTSNVIIRDYSNSVEQHWVLIKI